MARSKTTIRTFERLANAALASVLVATAAPALEFDLPGDRSLSISGYYKNFLLGIDSSLPGLEDGISDINRLRLMFDTALSDTWEVSLHYETIAEINPLLGGGLFFESRDRPGLTPLSWPIDRTDNLSWSHEIDRLQIRGRLAWGDVTIGRQAIGWGVGVVWAPLDLLVGFSPVQVDREFRLGVDAARAIVPLGNYTEVELVYAAYDTRFPEQVTAVRWRTTLQDSGIDFGLVAGKFFEDIVVGALAVGEVNGVGLHSSVNLTHHYGDDVGPSDYARIVAGADYRFENNIIAIAEYYFNGWGASDAGQYITRATAQRLQRGELFNVGRHYLGAIIDWEAHPLVHLAGRSQINLLDPSAQIGPIITISLSDEAQLEAGAYFAIGSRLDGFRVQSEFGLQPHFFYTAAKVYF